MAKGKHAAPKSGTGRAGWGVLGMVFGLLLAMSIPAMAEQNAVTPSTNDINRDLGWAHFNVLQVRRGEVDVQFVSTREFASCFEYRSDDEAPTLEGPNFNTDIHDGLWAFRCVDNSSEVLTISADTHVDIRMVFGAESDERFDWSRVDVLAPLAKDDCKSGGYEAEGFSNQGRCVASTQANERAGLGPDTLPRGRR